MRMTACLILFALATPSLAAAPRHPVGRPFRDSPIAPEMVAVPAGQVMEGSSEAETTREQRTPAFAVFEHPRRTVTIDRRFAIATHHVTNKQFAAFAEATGRDMAGCIVLQGGAWSAAADPAYSFANPGWKARNDEPAVCVSWDDATAYAAWLSAKTGHRYRLPSEAEWEYAARAGTTTARWWGNGRDDLCARTNGGDRDYHAVMPSDASANLTCSDGYPYVSPVDHYRANAWGLHDMYGNAWQWTADCFAPVPATQAAAKDCAAHTIRGGSWHSSPSTLRSATRFSLPTSMRASSLGFRVVRDMP